MARPLLLSTVYFALACGGQSAPPVDTPASLPPAEPPADVTRDEPVKAADSGKLEQQPDAKPVQSP